MLCVTFSHCCQTLTSVVALRQCEREVVNGELQDVQLMHDVIERSVTSQLSTSLLHEIQRSLLPCMFYRTPLIYRRHRHHNYHF